jgi:hypothetical protein
MNYWGNHIWSSVAAAGALVIFISAVADRRRQKRINFEKVGFMPWTGITVFAVMVTLMATALAIKGSLQ